MSVIHSKKLSTCSDIFFIKPFGSPAVVNRRTSNKYLFIKIRSWNEPITQRLRLTGSPAGLSRVIMASAVVVLKHENLTLRQRHNYISIDFKFGVGDYYVREVTNPDKVGSGPMSGRDATWGQHIRVL